MSDFFCRTSLHFGRTLSVGWMRAVTGSLESCQNLTTPWPCSARWGWPVRSQASARTLVCMCARLTATSRQRRFSSLWLKEEAFWLVAMPGTGPRNTRGKAQWKIMKVANDGVCSHFGLIYTYIVCTAIADKVVQGCSKMSFFKSSVLCQIWIISPKYKLHSQKSTDWHIFLKPSNICVSPKSVDIIVF